MDGERGGGAAAGERPCSSLDRGVIRALLEALVLGLLAVSLEL